MARSYDAIYQEKKKQVDAAVEEQYTARQASDDQSIQQIHAAIDRQADSASAGYQSRIDNADNEFQQLYDQNALGELITRRQVEESMANLGLTDSGLNRTQQTAIGIQRANADADTRTQQRQYVQQAQEAIDQIRSNAATEKLTQETSIRKDTADWLTAARLTGAQTAQTNAATEYSAEQEAAAKVEAAQIEAMQKLSSDNAAARSSYAQALIKTGNYTEEQAWASAFARYGAGDEESTTWYQNYSRALNGGYTTTQATAFANAGGGTAGEDALQALEINNAKAFAGSGNLLKNAGVVLAMFKYGKDNAKYVVEKLAKQLPALEGYDQLTDNEKTLALAIASGNTIKARWGSEDSEFKQKLAEGLADKFTGVALDAAIKAAGI